MYTIRHTMYKHMYTLVHIKCKVQLMYIVYMCNCFNSTTCTLMYTFVHVHVHVYTCSTNEHVYTLCMYNTCAQLTTALYVTNHECHICTCSTCIHIYACMHMYNEYVVHCICTHVHLLYVVDILYLYLLEVNGFAYDLVVLWQLLASG